ncbi:MAG: transglycosylase SLT domain-containing protein [Acidobacteriia bacterium]|nr:transglycosylase SLT domain-containing protein [Terriglobia bacterium]
MDDRTKRFSSVLVLAIALTAAGCGYTQQSKFQTSFLPPAPRPSALASLEIAEPPILQTNPYLQDVPFLSTNPFLTKPSRADALQQRAEQAFQLGKAAYQADDIATARQQFDNAVDLMFEATGQIPSDHQEYERRLEEMVDSIHRFDLAGMGASVAIEDVPFEKAPLEDILEMTFPVDPRLKDKVREQVAATVSQLPLTVTDPVLGYIHYFSGRGHKTLVAATQRSGRYRPMIQRVLAEEGVPQELIHLAQAESGFIPRAMSRKAAGGMWQFLKWRGQQYGLMQTRYTDDRMDPEKATRAAAHHLHDLYNEFGDWYLAIAAYNCGPGTVEKAVERTGYADFWELRNSGALPAETTNYVPIILAMTIMEKNSAEYGLDGIPLDPPLAYDTVDITATTSMALISDLTDTPAPELLALNPAILRNVVVQGYALHVPKGKGSPLTAALQLIPADRRASWRIHRVVTGETLASIGKRFGVPSGSIVSANGLRKAEAEEGDWLMIPAALRSETPVRHAATQGAAVRRHTARRHAPAKTALKSKTPAKPVRTASDTLIRTAQR